MNKLNLSSLEEKDIDVIVSSFKKLGWDTKRSTYEKYLDEQNQNLRSIVVVKDRKIFCGYVTIKWKSDYQPFKLKDVPKIADLNVLPEYRKQGIGTLLIQACERMAKDRGYPEIGLGVGLTSDYGDAQRLYIRLGYLPDGRGLHYKNKALNYADSTIVDDDLVLYFTKKLDNVS